MLTTIENQNEYKLSWVINYQFVTLYVDKSIQLVEERYVWAVGHRADVITRCSRLLSLKVVEAAADMLFELCTIVVYYIL